MVRCHSLVPLPNQSRGARAPSEAAWPAGESYCRLPEGTKDSSSFQLHRSRDLLVYIQYVSHSEKKTGWEENLIAMAFNLSFLYTFQHRSWIWALYFYDHAWFCSRSPLNRCLAPWRLASHKTAIAKPTASQDIMVGTGSIMVMATSVMRNDMNSSTAPAFSTQLCAVRNSAWIPWAVQRWEWTVPLSSGVDRW